MSSKNQYLGKISHQNVPARTISARRAKPSVRMALALALAVLGIWRPAWAEGPVQRYAIPAGSLEDALMEFAAQSDLRLIFKTDLVRSVRSAGLTGTLTPEQGVARLLEGTGIAYRFVDSNTVTIEPAVPVDPLERPVAEARTSMEYAGATEPAPKKPKALPPKKNDAGPTMLPEMTVTAKPTDPTSYSVPNATTATKTDTPIMETPVSIQVVPQQVLKDQQAINILEPLNRNVSGVLARTGGGFEFDNFIVRGFSTNGFGTAYRNGLLNRGNVYEPANIEQIEVLKGPAAVFYGRVEPGGLINYVTKRPLDTPYYAIQQQFGSHDLYRTTIDATGPIDDDRTLLYRLNAAYLDTKSFRDFIVHDRVFVAPALTWRPTSDFEANVEVEYNRESRVNDSGIPALGTRPAPIPLDRFLGDSSQGDEYESTLVAYDWTYRFNDGWKLTNRFHWRDWNRDSYNIGNSGLEPDNRTLNRRFVLGVGRGRANVRDIATNLDLTGNFDGLGARHDVLIGVDYFHHDTESPGIFFGSTPGLPPIDIFNPVYGVVDQTAVRQLTPNNFFLRTHEWYGVYFQDQITLWDKLHLLAGGRYDWAKEEAAFSTIDLDSARAALEPQENNEFSPRVGVLYELQPWLSVYGSYTESFGDSNGRSATGEVFDPTIGTQYEVGFKMQTLDQRLSATVAYYDLTRSNLLTADPNNPDFSILAGEAQSQGVEVDIQGQVTERLNLIATYAHTDARFTQDNSGFKGKHLDNVPRNQASLWGTYQFNDSFRMGLGGVAVGSRQGDMPTTPSNCRGTAGSMPCWPIPSAWANRG